MEKYGRLITAMVTPFDAGGAVDFKQAGKLARSLMKSGSDGLVVSGTTGESPTLSRDEKLRLFTAVKEAVGKGGMVIAGTGSNNTADSVALTGEAEKTGVDAIMLVVPYYNKPTQEGLYQHFKTIAAATRLPVILYNVPGRTVTNLAPETVIRLSKIDNIFAVKEASANLEQIAKIIEGADQDFLVYSGNDADTLPILALGGYGVVSVVSHLVGKQIHDMIDNFIAGKSREAASIHRRLLPMVNAMFIVSNPIPLKYALNKVGFNVGNPRLPLLPPDEKSAASIDATLKNYKIDLVVD
ncbi:MAG: 4-hydroxy-tetrahydrodipicolinate synthase [Dehalococcoidia bacterium]|nr:4-hydroxy-tetrahydrodipicolinate synthase [Dehalococcoidia bacterium]